MSKPLIGLGLALLLGLGVLPLLVLGAQVGLDDLALLGEARVLSLLGRTFMLGVGAALIATVLGVPFGFFVARTNVPGVGLLRPLGAVPLFLPSLLVAVAWAPLCDLRGGLAATLILGFTTFPLVALFATRAFERVDAARAEAAQLIGGWRASLRMELPLVAPAALAGAALAFAFAVNDYATPDYVSSVGVKFNVYADEVFSSWSQLNDPGRAVAKALPLIAMTLLTLLPALRLRRRGALATQDGTFRRPTPYDLGAWRWLALAFCLVPISIGALIPLARMTFEAAQGSALLEAGTLSAASFAGNLRESFGLAIERARGDLLNSVVFAVSAALVVVPLGLILGHAIERAPRRAGRALEIVSLLPIAMPAVLFGIGSILVWSRPATADLYASGTMAVLLYAGRFLPFGVLLLSGAVAAVDVRQEEAAALAGARPAKRLGRIVAPNVLGSMAGAFVLVFVFAMRELDSSILVPAANKTAMLRLFNGVHFDRDEYVAALSLLIVFAILLPGLLWNLFSRRRLAILP